MDVAGESPARGGRRWISRCAAGLAVSLAGVTSLGVTATAAHAVALPDGRVYEQVTPTDTGGLGAIQQTGSVGIPIGDDAFIWGGGAQPVTSSQSGYNPVFLATRTSAGWTSTSLLPASYSPYAAYSLQDATNDASAMVFSTGTSAYITPQPSNPVPFSLVYRDAAGQFSTIVADASPDDSSAPSVADPSQYGGMSADGQVVDYSSTVGPGGAEGTRQVYRWTPAAGSTPLTTTGPLAGCGGEIAGLSDYSVVPSTTITDGSGSFTAATTNTVSADGSSVFLESGNAGSGCPAATQLYVDDAGQTTLVSTPTDGTAAPHGASVATVAFIGATPDGSTAYFATTERLAHGATAGDANIYRWQAASSTTSATVSCITCATPAATNLGPAELSANGQYLYFDATGVIGGVGSSGSEQLLAFHAGQLVDIGPIQSGAENNGGMAISPAGDEIVYQPGQPTANGTNPLFVSRISGGGASTPQCISCQADGTPGDGLVGLVNASTNNINPSPAGASTVAGTMGGSISADDDHIVFTSDDALGTASDSLQVYEWTPSSGPVRIGDGAGSTSIDAGISADGSDLYFFTPDALPGGSNPQNTIALYDARVGGGFPAGAAAPTCVGDACQGPISVPPAAPGVGSAGGSSGAPRARVIGRPRALATRVRVHRRELEVVLKVRGRGELQVTGTARVGHRSMTVVRLHRKRFGTDSVTRSITLRLALDAAGRRALASTHRLRITVRVTFGGRRLRRSTVTLRTSRGAHR